jgi:hypothetical protein
MKDQERRNIVGGIDSQIIIRKDSNMCNSANQQTLTMKRGERKEHLNQPGK